MQTLPSVKASNLIVKSNSIVESSYALSLNAFRLLALAISIIPKGAKELPVLEISGKEIGSIFPPLNSHKGLKKTLEDAVDDLMKAHVTVRSGDDWIKLQWVTAASYKNAILYLKLHGNLLPYLTSLFRCYTAYELQNLIHLNTAYQFRIYDLCKQFENIGRRIVSIEQFRFLLQIPQGQYKQASHLRTRIILPSLVRISETSDLTVRLSEIKKRGRKVTEFVFEIKRNKKTAIGFDTSVDFSDQGLANVEDNDKVGGRISCSKVEIVETLVSYGLSRKKSVSLVGEYDLEYLNEKIAYSEKQYDAGRVRTMAGFIVKAIEDDFATRRANTGQLRYKSSKARTNMETQKTRKQTLQNETAVNEFLEGLSEAEHDAYIETFVNEHCENSILMSLYKKQGLKSPIIKKSLNQFVLEFISTPHN